MCPCNLYIAYSYAKSLESISQLSNDLPEDFRNAVFVRNGGKRVEIKNIWRFFHKPWWERVRLDFFAMCTK